MAEIKENQGGPQELQPDIQRHLILRKLSSFARATVDNMDLFLHSKQYPPNVVGIMNNWNAIDAIPIRIITSYPSEADRAKENELRKKLGDVVQKRMPLVGTLIENLIPAVEELKPTETGGFVYPQDKISEIFNQEDAKYRVRAISFLLDPDIAKWWTVVGDEEFNKFQELVKENKLPDCLVSDEEMIRLWNLDREAFAYEWHRMTDLYKSSHPEFAGDVEGSTPSKEHEQPVEMNAARYTFLDLYQEHKDMDTTLIELVNMYPNEKAPGVSLK